MARSSSHELTALAAQRGLTVAEEFADVVESGTDENRPGFRRMHHAMCAKARAWSAVLILDTSRTACDPWIAAFFERDAKRQAVRVIFKSIPDEDPINAVVLKSVMPCFDQTWNGRKDDEAAQALANVSESQVRTMLRNLADEIRLYDTDELKDFLSTILERVELDPDQATLQVCYRIPLRGGNKCGVPKGISRYSHLNCQYLSEARRCGWSDDRTVRSRLEE